MQNWRQWKVFIIPALYVILTFGNIRITTGSNKKKLKEIEASSSSDDDSKKSSSNDNMDLKNADLKKKNKSEEEETTEEQLDSMKQMTNNMNYMMPIMSISISLIAPLGLSLYWLVSNVLQLSERFVIDKVVGKKEQEEVKNG